MITIDTERLTSELAKLATFSDAPAPAVTRVVYSPVDQQARTWFKGLCAEAGLAVREDAAGNTFVRLQGAEPDLPAVGTGSHFDALPFAGAYDGTVGVFGGLEALRALKQAKVPLKRSVELLLFTSEEPTRFGIGCLGSRLLTGDLDASAGQRLRDPEGKTLDEARAEAGFNGPLASMVLKPGYYSSFVELHIEQGPLLEKASLPLGIVTAIAAPASLRVYIEGQGGHAGAVLMPARHDALCAAAELILAVEKAAKTTGAVDTVGTTGICEVFPSAVNSVPSKVMLALDVRDTNRERRDGVLKQIEEACKDTASRRGVHVRTEMINADAPCECDPAIIDAVERACKKYQQPYQKMVSRAYHDTLFMSRVTPAGMVFIPCRAGVSHRPEEYATPEDIARGTLILAEAMAELASK